MSIEGNEEQRRQAEQFADAQAMQHAFRQEGKLPPDMQRVMGNEILDPALPETTTKKVPLIKRLAGRLLKQPFKKA